MYYRVCTDPEKSWEVLELKCGDIQAWKVLEKGIGPGRSWKTLEKSWNSKVMVLEILISGTCITNLRRNSL